MKKDNPFIPKPPALIPDIPIVWSPNALVTNIKGGVGKSSLSRAINHHWGSTIITNDLCYGQDKEDIVHLEPRSKSLPSEVRGLSPVVYDFGAMHASLDTKIAQACDECDLIIIPTFLDDSCLHASIETYRLFEQEKKPIVFLFNAIGKADEPAADTALQYIQDQVGEVTAGNLPRTVLFQRMVKDGSQWSESVFNELGRHQLRKSWLKVTDLLDELAELVKEVK